MGRELNMDTQRQNFWKEAIEKECSVRVSWMVRNRGEVPYRSSKSSQEKRLAGRAMKVRGNIPKPPEPERSIALPSIKSKQQPDAASSCDKKQSGHHQRSEKESVADEMRRVSPSIRKLLYKGFTKEGKGRYQYLQARTAKKPEQKYKRPLVSSWDYGWQLDDVVKDFHAPEHGRSRIVRDTFFRRNGILYEPITA